MSLPRAKGDGIDHTSQVTQVTKDSVDTVFGHVDNCRHAGNGFELFPRITRRLRFNRVDRAGIGDCRLRVEANFTVSTLCLRSWGGGAVNCFRGFCRPVCSFYSLHRAFRSACQTICLARFWMESWPPSLRFRSDVFVPPVALSFLKDNHSQQSRNTLRPKFGSSGCFRSFAGRLPAWIRFAQRCPAAAGLRWRRGC